MSKVEMKVGEWYEDGINCRYYCALELPDNVGGTHRFVCYNQAGTIETYTASGVYYGEDDQSDLDIVRHLPGCTGFDWQEPKFKVGDVVYANKPKTNNIPGISWVPLMDEHDGKRYVVRHITEDGHVYLQGVSKWEFHPDWLSKEPPAAQYRPFANDEEYAPHFDRPVKRAYNKYPEGKGAYKIAAYDEYGVWHREGGMQDSYEEMYKSGRKFADTNEPFGVKIS
jgi:hypothetical protein